MKHMKARIDHVSSPCYPDWGFPSSITHDITGFVFCSFYRLQLIVKKNIHLKRKILVTLRSNDKLKDDRQSFVKLKFWR